MHSNIYQTKGCYADWLEIHRKLFLLKKGRSEEFQDVNNVVSRWFCMSRETLIHVLGTVFQEEAMQIPLKLDVTGFILSNGWKQLSVAEKKCSIKHWNDRFLGWTVARNTERLWTEEMWNADKTGLFWLTLPDKLLSVLKGRKGGNNE